MTRKPRRKERHSYDGSVYSPDIRDHRPGCDTSDLAPQQKVGLLSHRWHQRDHFDSSVPLLDGPFVIQANFTVRTFRFYYASQTTHQEALYAAGIPATAFLTADIESEYERLKKLGVVFRSEPKKIGPIISAFFEDTCGNPINLVQPST